MRNDNDDPIKELNGIFDKLNSYENENKYEYEKKIDSNDINERILIYNLNNKEEKKFSEEINGTDYTNFNRLSESQKIDVSNSFLKIYLRIIKVFISVVIAFTVIKAFMEHYMIVEDKFKERIEERATQNTVQTSNQNTTEKQNNYDYSHEAYALTDSISFIDYGTVPTVAKYGSYDGYYEWGPKENDSRFNGNTSIYEVKYEALPSLDIFNYTRALERRNYKIVGQFEGEDIYLLEVDTNKFLFVIICEDYAIYGAGNGDYKTTFNLK